MAIEVVVDDVRGDPDAVRGQLELDAAGVADVRRSDDFLSGRGDDRDAGVGRLGRRAGCGRDCAQAAGAASTSPSQPPNAAC